MDELQQDQIWWAKLPGAPMLSKVVLVIVTAKTVGIAHHVVNKLQQQAPVRFKREDIDFVELADE
jgi:hypothetical protein